MLDGQELIDREMIREILYRYCRAVDRLDPAEIAKVFWDDATYLGGPFPDDMSAKDFLALGMKATVEDIFAVTTHSLSNIIIEIDGETAQTESYATCYHLSYPNEAGRVALIGTEHNARLGFSGDDVVEFVLSLRYIDRFEKRAGEWRIARRSLVLNWSQVQKWTGITDGGLYDTFRLRSIRGPGDPVYHNN